jgi:hypothetical protein
MVLELLLSSKAKGAIRVFAWPAKATILRRCASRNEEDKLVGKTSDGKAVGLGPPRQK